MISDSVEKLNDGTQVDQSLLVKPRTTMEMFGHVSLVEGYAVPSFTGCHALVTLRDSPGKTVAVITSYHNFQTLFETALATGNLVAFRGSKLTSPPTPLGGTWALDVYSCISVIVYGMK